MAVARVEFLNSHVAGAEIFCGHAKTTGRKNSSPVGSDLPMTGFGDNFSKAAYDTTKFNYPGLDGGFGGIG
jgi:hypothetical protein